MALKSGFYNAVEIESGVYDRTYSADEYTNFYSAFLKDGVRRSGMNDFICTANGLIITIGAGFAICGSKWVHNDTAETLAAVTPPTGQYSRIDGVFLHVDTNEATRAASFIYRTGTAAATPVPPEKDSTSGVYELCLCYVAVAPNATTVQITDKRADSTVCGWITTPVGYDDFFERFETEFDSLIARETADFETWFSNLRETVATTTMYKQYTQYIKTTADSTSTATIEIVQYDPTGVDILQVFVNGMLLISGVDYTASGTTITFTTPKIAGTEILIVVYKSIDGAGLGSVSDEITQLQNDVAALESAVQDIQSSIGGLLVSETRRSSQYQIAGHNSAGRNFNIDKEGYTPVGFGYINIESTNGSEMSISSFEIRTQDGSKYATITITNGESSARSVVISFTVLYIKNAE